MPSLAASRVKSQLEQESNKHLYDAFQLAAPVGEEIYDEST